MTALPPLESSPSRFSPETTADIIELGLLNGTDDESLGDLFLALWYRGQFRVSLDCSYLDRFAAREVCTLMRFASQFSAHGGFVHLTRVNARVRSLLEVLHCAELLVPNAGTDTREAGGTITTSV